MKCALSTQEGRFFDLRTVHNRTSLSTSPTFLTILYMNYAHRDSHIPISLDDPISLLRNTNNWRSDRFWLYWIIRPRENPLRDSLFINDVRHKSLLNVSGLENVISFQYIHQSLKFPLNILKLKIIYTRVSYWKGLELEMSCGYSGVCVGLCVCVYVCMLSVSFWMSDSVQF